MNEWMNAWMNEWWINKGLVNTTRFFIYFSRVDISAIEGQTSRLSVILRGTQSSRLVKCYSSNPEELQVRKLAASLRRSTIYHGRSLIPPPQFSSLLWIFVCWNDANVWGRGYQTSPVLNCWRLEKKNASQLEVSLHNLHVLPRAEKNSKKSSMVDFWFLKSNLF